MKRFGLVNGIGDHSLYYKKLVGNDFVATLKKDTIEAYATVAVANAMRDAVERNEKIAVSCDEYLSAISRADNMVTMAMTRGYKKAAEQIALGSKANSFSLSHKERMGRRIKSNAFWTITPGARAYKYLDGNKLHEALVLALNNGCYIGSDTGVPKTLNSSSEERTYLCMRVEDVNLTPPVSDGIKEPVRHDDEDLNLGDFVICVPIGGKSAHEILFVEQDSHSYETSYSHPHLQDRSMCWGEVCLTPYLNNFLYMDAFDVMEVMLRTYNHDSPYLAWDAWFDGDLECCICSTVMAEDETVHLPSGDIACTDCVEYCESCDEYYDKDNMCYVDDHVICEMCCSELDRCDHCEAHVWDSGTLYSVNVRQVDGSHLEEVWCPACAEDSTALCEECEEFYEDDDGDNYDRDTNTVCLGSEWFCKNCIDRFKEAHDTEVEANV